MGKKGQKHQHPSKAAMARAAGYSYKNWIAMEKLGLPMRDVVAKSNYARHTAIGKWLSARTGIPYHVIASLHPKIDATNPKSAEERNLRIMALVYSMRAGID